MSTGAEKLAGVRARVAALLLVAAIPVAMLAVFIAVQNYRIGVGAAVERAQLFRAAAAAQNHATLAAATPILAALALSPAIVGDDASGCHATLARAHDLVPDRMAALLVVKADGFPRCSSAGPGQAPLGDLAGEAWFRHLRSGLGPVVTATEFGPSGAPVIASVPVLGPGGAFAGAVAGWLAIVPPTDPTGSIARGKASLWLLGTAGAPQPLAGAAAQDMPDAATLGLVEDSPAGVALGRSRAGRSYAYAVAPLAERLRLLVGTDAAQDIAAARSTLEHRLTGLALLLGLGLAAVAVGAERALVQPIKRLSASVQAWRAGAAFDPGPIVASPTEIRHLAESFAAAAADLARREKELEVAAGQHELLMKEIHHRVKNNLQIVASLLNLQAGRIRLPEAKREFASARDRVRALATLHRHLYSEGDVRTINMGTFLRELCGQLLHAIGEPTGTRVDLQVDAPALQLDSDQAVPIALIVTEAVSNAAKHAFPGERSGRIRVALSVADGRMRLLIEDDGVGLPPGAAGPGAEGIGLHLIRGFARQLGAKLTVTDGDGLRYDLTLDLAGPNGAGEAATGPVRQEEPASS